MAIYKRKITVADDEVTSAVHLTLRQSLIPCFLGESHPGFLADRVANIPSQSPSSSSSGRSPCARDRETERDFI